MLEVTTFITTLRGLFSLVLGVYLVQLGVNRRSIVITTFTHANSFVQRYLFQLRAIQQPPSVVSLYGYYCIYSSQNRQVISEQQSYTHCFLILKEDIGIMRKIMLEEILKGNCCKCL